jgi:hypothetical protein
MSKEKKPTAKEPQPDAAPVVDEIPVEIPSAEAAVEVPAKIPGKQLRRVSLNEARALRS